MGGGGVGGWEGGRMGGWEGGRVVEKPRVSEAGRRPRMGDTSRRIVK